MSVDRALDASERKLHCVSRKTHLKQRREDGIFVPVAASQLNMGILARGKCTDDMVFSSCTLGSKTTLLVYEGTGSTFHRSRPHFRARRSKGPKQGAEARGRNRENIKSATNNTDFSFSFSHQRHETAPNNTLPLGRCFSATYLARAQTRP